MSNTVCNQDFAKAKVKGLHDTTKQLGIRSAKQSLSVARKYAKATLMGVHEWLTAGSHMSNISVMQHDSCIPLHPVSAL